MQISVAPAKLRPAPTNVGIRIQVLLTKKVSAIPMRMSNPAPNLTCRSSDQLVWSADTNGRPASRHARVPPSNTAIVARRRSRFFCAMQARVPASQTRTRSPSSKSAWRNGSCCSGMHFAPGTCPAANSVSERTSTISGLWPERHNCESSCTLMVAVKDFSPSYRKSPAGNKGIHAIGPFETWNHALIL